MIKLIKILAVVGVTGISVGFVARYLSKRKLKKKIIEDDLHNTFVDNEKDEIEDLDGWFKDVDSWFESIERELIELEKM